MFKTSLCPTTKGHKKDPKAAKPGSLETFPSQHRKTVSKPLPTTANKKNYSA